MAYIQNGYIHGLPEVIKYLIYTQKLKWSQSQYEDLFHSLQKQITVNYSLISN